MIFVYQFTVDHVHDGDTVMGELDQGLGVYQRPISVRFSGVDAPELSTAEGKAAAAQLQLLVQPGMVCTIHSVGWDKYSNRIDARPFQNSGGTDVIEAGLLGGWLRPWTGTGPRPW